MMFNLLPRSVVNNETYCLILHYWYQILSAGVKFGVNIASMYICTRKRARRAITTIVLLG